MSDLDDDDFTTQVLIDFEQEITMVRLMESTFLPSWMTIKAELIPVSDEVDDDAFDFAITKMKFWLEAVAPRCIAFARGNEAAVKMLVNNEGRNNSANLLMLCPAEPTDEHLAALFQAKLTALCGPSMIVGSVTIQSSNMVGLTFRFVGSADEVLPEMTNWIGDFSYFEEPWWNRADASTLDVVPGEDDDLTKRPEWAYTLDFLGDIGRSQQDVVLRPDFSPTVITGGKTDE